MTSSQSSSIKGAVRVPAFAKINLSLLVLYKRPDGFHELRTVFQTISLADRLEIAWRPGRGARVAVECEPPIDDNIAGRAAQKVLEATNARGEVSIRIEKRIPIGGGMGGGSSDAAAVLLTLPILTRRPMPESKLHDLAAGLGSDVAFFLMGGTTLGSGRGEELYPLESVRERFGLVVLPGAAVSTAEAYRGLAREPLTDLTQQGFSPRMKEFQSMVRSLQCLDPRHGWKAFCENDFEAAVFAQHPSLKSLQQKLQRLGARPVRMSGSGSALFGLFASRQKQVEAARAFARVEAGVRVERISFLSREQYRAAWFRSLGRLVRNKKWPPQS